MAWTQTDLDALEAALRDRVRRVQYADRIVEYHTLDEMLKLRDTMKQAIGAAAGTVRSTYGSFSKD